jgi:hypothetical protein
MAGALTISTLNDSSGVLATQNGMTGIAKAWVNFNGTGTVAIRGSFNVSSITDNGTGDYTVNFTTSLPNTTYSAVATSGNLDATTAAGCTSTTNRATGSCKVYTGDGVSSTDRADISFSVFSS